MRLLVASLVLVFSAAAASASAQDAGLGAADAGLPDASPWDGRGADGSVATTPELVLSERDSVTLRVAFVGPSIEARHRRAARLVGQGLEALIDAPLRIEVSVGSYDEVTTWVGREAVDVALLPVVAYSAVRGNPRIHVLAGSEQRVPFSSDARGRRHYRSVAVTRAGSALAVQEPVAMAALAERLEGARWLFIHPLSASGFLVPRAALRAADVVPDPSRVRFTFSQERAREVLSDSAGERGEVLAFLSGEQWERAQREAPELRRVPIEELDAIAIPSDVFVTTSRFLERMGAVLDEAPEPGALVLRARRALIEAEATPRSARVLDDLGLAAVVEPVAADYERFLDAQVRQAFGRDRVRPSDIRYSARHLMQRIEALQLAATESGAERPRVALVLSGGGNKCAFEAGVLNELYGHGFAPDVVVGTSGGAFNAIGVVAGFAEPETRGEGAVLGVASPTRLEALWLGLRADDVVPTWCALSATVLWLVWVLFLGLTAGALRLVLFGRFQVSIEGELVALDEEQDDSPEEWPRRRARSRRAASIAAVCFGVSALAAGVALVFEDDLPFRWGALGIARAGAIVAALVAVLRLWAVAEVVVEEGEAEDLRRRMAKRLLGRPARWTQTALTALAMVGLVLYVEGASELVPTDGVRDFLAHQIERGALEGPAAVDGMARAEAISHTLGAEERMRADLVLTVTPFGGDALRRLPVDSPLVEHEVRQHYMWFPQDPAQLAALVANPERAILEERRLRWFQPLPHRHMVDIAAASGALFPIFGLHHMTIDGREGDFVDGGYAHNIPVEAASLWGARIIVVIRASPIGVDTESADALDNLARAFETLYARAQRSDNPSEHGTAVFEIGPTESYAILSFHPDDLARSVSDGRAAASDRDVFGAQGFVEVESALPHSELVRRARSRVE